MKETRITISSYSENWFNSHVQGQLAHNTENGYRNLIFNHIMPHFKNVALTELTEKKIQNFYKKLSDQGLSSRSVWCVHLLLRRILDEACRDGLLTENPAADITVPHEETQPAMRLRSSQIRRYLETAKELNVYPILYIGLTSGLRQGELISLPWAAFDLSTKRLRLQKRWINLSDTAAQVLAEEHRRHPQSPYMFLDSKTNQPYTPHRLYYLHRRILKQAHLPAISFRDLQTSAKEMRL